jgi:hypothetical protein
MIGRLIRWTFTATCAASLLACLFTAFLWFHARRVYRDSAEATVRRTYVWATSDRDGVSAWIIRGWRWPVPLSVRSAADADQVEYYVLWITRADWQRAFGRNGAFTTGTAAAWVAPDGTPPRVSGHWNPMFQLQTSPPMPAWVVTNAPHWAIIVLTSLAPLAWALLRLRRRQSLRRRARLGLCLHCGYDLRACRDSGRCSECGEAIPAERTPSLAPLRS